MIRLLLIVAIFSTTFVACTPERPVHNVLNIYIVSKEPGAGLHEAVFPAFPKLGYIADKPDLTIEKLEGVAYGLRSGMPKPDGGHSKPVEDSRSLKFHLTAQDAEVLNKLTAAHVGARLLLLLNDEPLVAPEITNPSLGQYMYINNLPRTVDTEKLKAKLETLVEKPKHVQSSAAPAAKTQPTATAALEIQPSVTVTPKPAI